MIIVDDFNIDQETINKVGLRVSDGPVNTPNALIARVFEYPHLDSVYVMENDLYGNRMPKNYCFLAFYGHHGLIGKELEIETLRNATVEDIKNIVETNKES
jgi:hypothetical protein